MSGPHLSPLLAKLSAAGVTLALDANGTGIKVQASAAPSPGLLEELKAAKPEVLAYLRAKGGQNAPTLAKVSGSETDAVKEKAPSAPDWAALSLEAGRCGSCQRFTPSPEWGPYMGACGCPAAAWLPGRPPLSIHMGHACAAYGGQGYRPQFSALSEAPRPAERRL